MNKSRPKSTSFIPNPKNIGGKAQISQQMYNHYNRLYSVKSTINAEKPILKKAGSKRRSTQVPLQPYSTEALYQKSKQKEKKPVLLHNGISLDQWKTINSFSIVGQSNKKKANFNTAIDHFFNLKAMYRRINQEKFRAKKDQGALVFKKRPIANAKPNPNLAHALTIERKAQENVRTSKPNTNKAKSKSQAKASAKPKNDLKKQKVKREKIGATNNADNKKLIKITENIEDSDLQNTHEEMVINDNINKLQQYEMDKSDDDKNVIAEEDSDMKALAELQEKIPYIDKSSSQEALNEFKQAMVELIFEYEIFNEEDFEKFFELCCMKCNEYDSKDMESLFDEVKLYLYEQLKGDIEEDVE